MILSPGDPPRPVVIFGSGHFKTAIGIEGKHSKSSLNDYACSLFRILLLNMNVEILFIFRTEAEHSQ